MPLRDLSGHRHLLELLARAVGRASLPQSLIFGGPEGVGKRATARALGQAVNCEQPVEWPQAPGRDACGTCASCRRIARGVHADILVVEAEESGSIKIEQIRDAVDRASYRPFEGRRRIVIIDGADAMVPHAQDALLKTLEEPPPASVFVLVTAVPDILMPTIRSRCQRLRFGPLSPAEVADVLIRAHGMSAVNAHAAAAASDGSIGRALEGAADDVGEAREAAERLLHGVAAARDPRRRLEGAKGFVGSADREELGRRLRALLSLLRDLSLLVARADDRALANADLKPQLVGLVKTFDRERALRAFAAVDRALSALDRNASPKIVADWVALQI